MVTAIEAEIEARAAGFDPDRLARMDRHLMGYVDDGRLPRWLHPPTLLSGGGGLVSSGADYLRFARMLAGEGQLDGVRLLGNRTARRMTRNHLPHGSDLDSFGRPM